MSTVFTQNFKITGNYYIITSHTIKNIPNFKEKG